MFATMATGLCEPIFAYTVLLADSNNPT